MSIASQITALTADKSAIASAITAKGGTVASDDGFDDFATAIASIPSGGGSLDDVNIYILDFVTDTIVLTAGGMSPYGECFTT